MNLDKATNGLLRLANIIQENKYISAISDGLMTTMPLMIVGSIGSIINSLGIPAWQNFLTSTGLKTITSLPSEIGTNMFALFAVFAIGYRFAKSQKKDGMTAGVLCLMSFLMLTPMEYNEMGSVSAIPSTWLGAQGLFVAMIVGVLASMAYCFFVEHNIVIKMPQGVPPVVERTFGSILPALAIGFVSLVVSFLFTKTHFGSMHGFIYELVAKPLTGLGGTFAALLIAVLFTQLMWSVGIHGTMVALSVFYPIWAALDVANLAAFNAGETTPNIVSMQFFFLCAFAGGAGNTLGLILNMLLSKNDVNKALGKLALVPGLFGINEPIIFGMPIVLNPIIVIPFILSPLATTIIGYLGCTIGLIARPTGVSSIAGAPIIVNQFIMGGFSWAVWELLVIVISFFIYLPFFKMYEKKQAAEQSADEQQGTLDRVSESFEKATK